MRHIARRNRSWRPRWNVQVAWTTRRGVTHYVELGR